MAIQIRTMLPEDQTTVEDICFVTSEWGKQGKEALRELVALRWCRHYVQHEREHCHVAVDDENGAVGGYLLCAVDTRRQEKEFLKFTSPELKAEIQRQAPKPGLDRMKLKKDFGFIPTHQMGLKIKNVLEFAPAHLHIDLYPHYHRQGIGKMLFAAHENHLRDIGVKGYHLIVGSSNKTAVQFYRAMGMKEMAHIGGKLNFGIVFAKQFLEDG